MRTRKERTGCRANPPLPPVLIGHASKARYAVASALRDLWVPGSTDLAVLAVVPLDLVDHFTGLPRAPTPYRAQRAALPRHASALCGTGRSTIIAFSLSKTPRSLASAASASTCSPRRGRRQRAGCCSVGGMEECTSCGDAVAVSQITTHASDCSGGAASPSPRRRALCRRGARGRRPRPSWTRDARA